MQSFGVVFMLTLIEDLFLKADAIKNWKRIKWVQRIKLISHWSKNWDYLLQEKVMKGVVYMLFFCGIDSTWDTPTWRHKTHRKWCHVDASQVESIPQKNNMYTTKGGTDFFPLCYILNFNKTVLNHFLKPVDPSI